MNPSLKTVIEAFIEKEHLPAAYAHTVEHWFLPMVEEVLQQISSHDGPFVIGISGSQGSGKSTLAALIETLLKAMLGLRCVSLSIDDFYLTRAERQQLAESVHPLLATRGVPGTHDVSLAMDTLSALKRSGQVQVPRFDKAVDDRFPKEAWECVSAPVDVIILEGWCLSIDDQPDATLVQPVNALEADEDSDGVWRTFVNQAIRKNYQTFYNQVDFLVMLKAPCFEKVYEWRQNQEDKLAEKVAQDEGREAENRIMSTHELKRFIQHYERITRYGLKTLPEKADVVFQLTDNQTIEKRL